MHRSECWADSLDDAHVRMLLDLSAEHLRHAQQTIGSDPKGRPT